ncbi:MAG: hypothetical protein C5B49_04055 [Bdellovibrio sp.]|nr:MAG: hypothetical protein C5B49_04055 [Bdellovibrio sp.]
MRNMLNPGQLGKIVTVRFSVPFLATVLLGWNAFANSGQVFHCRTTSHADIRTLEIRTTPDGDLAGAIVLTDTAHEKPWVFPPEEVVQFKNHKNDKNEDELFLKIRHDHKPETGPAAEGKPDTGPEAEGFFVDVKSSDEASYQGKLTFYAQKERPGKIEPKSSQKLSCLVY